MHQSQCIPVFLYAYIFETTIRASPNAYVVITHITPSGKRMMKNGKEASFSKRYFGYYIDASGNEVHFEEMRPVNLKNKIDPNIKFK